MYRFIFQKEILFFFFFFFTNAVKKSKTSCATAQADQPLCLSLPR